ncbi:MAG: hypothetical protein IJM30_02490 [Thermoguttaceae bacterium]|nr:hypothetical protein [Thermoguttaceae bacterium]
MFNLSDKPIDSKASKNNYKRFNGVESPTRLSKRQAVGRSFLRFHRDEHGGTIFSLLIAVLGLAIMVGFTTNMASETIERQRVQHAADSLAYASGLWLARAMNAAASMSHVMGEKSAFYVMIDSLAGPEFEFEPCKQEQEMTDRLEDESKLLSYAIWSPKPDGTWTTGVPEPKSSQRENLKKVIENFTTKYYPDAYKGGSGEVYRAGAAVYDAKMQLKYYATDCLNNKAIATWLMGVDNSPSLDEFKALYIVGTGIHAIEDLILGTNSPDGKSSVLNADSLAAINKAINGVQGLKGDIGNMDKMLKKLGNNVLGPYMNQVSNVLQSLDSFKSKVEDQIGQIEQNLNSATAEIKEAANKIKDLQDKLTSLKKGLSEVGNSLKNPAKAMKEIKKLKKELKELSGSLKSLKGDFSKLGESLKKVLDPSVFQDLGKDIENMTSDLFGKVQNLGNLSLDGALEGLSNTFSEYGNKIADAYNGVLGGIEGIKGIVSDPKSALTGALGQLASSLLGSVFGNTTVCSERPIILDLEVELGEKSHDLRNEELLGQFEKIQKRYAIVVGANGNKQEDRLLYKKIHETADQLKKSYAIGDLEDGFSECVLSPWDTLVPDAKTTFKNDASPKSEDVKKKKEKEVKKAVEYQDSEPVGELYEIGTGRRLWIGFNPIKNIAGSDVIRLQYILTESKERAEQFSEWLTTYSSLDANSPCNEECRKAFQTYNDTIENIKNQAKKLEEENARIQELLDEKAWTWTKDTTKVAAILTKDVFLMIYGPKIKEALGATQAFSSIYKAFDKMQKYCPGLKNPENVKRIMALLPDVVLDICSSSANNAIGDPKEGSLIDKLSSSVQGMELLDLLFNGNFYDLKALDYLLEPLGNLASKVNDFYSIYQAGKWAIEEDEKRAPVIASFLTQLRDLDNAWVGLRDQLANLQKPTCMTPECEEEEEEEEEPVATESSNKTPFLPVLAEEEVTKGAGSNYLANSSAQKWRTSKNSPYGKLPVPPWTGTDENELVSNVQDIIRTITYATDAVLAGAIVYYCCEFQFHKAAHAGAILTGCIAFQVPGVNKSEWKPDKHGHKNNPSVWSYPANEFDYEVEQKSQWVRASNPVVDTLRSGLRKHYKKEVPISNLSTYLTAWSYRYTLSEAYYLKTGAQRPYPEANKSIAPCYQYVITGTNMENKGNESYWNKPEILDQMFSVCAIVQSKPRVAAAGPKVFKRLGETDGITASAQATFYPYNGRNVKKGDSSMALSNESTNAKVEKKENTQPNTCWDTLQWRNQNPGDVPIVNAPEWWNENPSNGPNAWSYETMTAPSTLDTLEDSKVELTWEAMTTPVTKSRLERVEDDSKATEAIKRAAKNAAEHAPLLAN